jgi:hypothetical protein
MITTRDFTGPGRAKVDQRRVPPGQYVTEDFPVLSAGPTPHTPLDRWTLTFMRRGGGTDRPHAAGTPARPAGGNRRRGVRQCRSMKTNKLLVAAVLAMAIAAPIAGFVGDTNVPQPTSSPGVRVPFLHGLPTGQIVDQLIRCMIRHLRV